MLLAVLTGRKTQTRRIISPQPGDSAPAGALRCPYGLRDDKLWVRERWAYADQLADRAAPDGGPIAYAADLPTGESRLPPWRSALHMPRSAARVVLEITATPQRLQDLSDADACAEGCPVDWLGGPVPWFKRLWDGLTGEGSRWVDNPWVWVIDFTLDQPRRVCLPHPAEIAAPARASAPEAALDAAVAQSREKLRDALREALRDAVRTGAGMPQT